MSLSGTVVQAQTTTAYCRILPTLSYLFYSLFKMESVKNDCNVTQKEKEMLKKDLRYHHFLLN